MNPVLADGLGMVGGVVLVAGYGYSNLAPQVNFNLFNLLNLIGSLLVIVSLLVHFNLASMLLEVTWAAIAALSIARGMLVKAR